MNAFEQAQRFVGEVQERAGRAKNNPLIQWWLDLCKLRDQPDETPWCSAFVNGVCWLLRLPRTKHAAARSWLFIGEAVPNFPDAKVGYDVVILKRGTEHAAHVVFLDENGGPPRYPPGHVGFFAGFSGNGEDVMVLGGNQGNEVTIRPFSIRNILGIRRLAA